jgi:excisionase family DNA binding protein
MGIAMTVTQAAKKIGISASKLYQLVTARKIAHYRVGGKIIFGDDDISAFLAECRVGTVPLNVTMPSRQPD